MRLRTRILAPMLATLALLGGAAVAAVVEVGGDAALTEARQDLAGRTARLAGEVNASLDARREAVALLAFVQAETAFATARADVPPAQAEAAREEARGLFRRATLGMFDRVALVGPDGRERAAFSGGVDAAPDAARDHGSAPAFQRLREAHLGPPLLEREPGPAPRLVALAAVVDGRGAFDGVVRAEVALAAVAPAGVPGLAGATAELVDAAGRALDGSADAQVAPAAWAAARPAGSGSGGAATAVAEGRLVAVAEAARVPVAGGGEEVWLVAAQLPVGTATAPVLRTVVQLGLALLAAALAAAAVVGAVLARALRPLERLTASVHRLGDGPPGGRVAPEGAEELRVLGGAFNAMVDRLEERERSLRRELETRAQDAKFATLGSLSAGVAHEVKNPLTGMRLQAELLGQVAARAKAGDAEAQRQLADAARKAADVSQRGIDRIEHVLASLSLLARPRPGLEEVDVAEVADASVALAGARLKSRAAVEVAAPPGLRAVATTDGLGQVLLNLVANAADAVPDEGGRIRIEASRRGQQVAIAVEDNGPGIPPEVEARLGQPFFTTKPHGTGLGLSISARIVQDLGGALRWENRAGGGARFVVLLPAA